MIDLPMPNYLLVAASPQVARETPSGCIGARSNGHEWRSLYFAMRGPFFFESDKVVVNESHVWRQLECAPEEIARQINLQKVYTLASERNVPAYQRDVWKQLEMGVGDEGQLVLDIWNNFARDQPEMREGGGDA